MEWIKIPEDTIPAEAEIRKVSVAGRVVCLVRHQDNLYATSVRCPHAGADLSGGWCEQGHLVCPYHRHTFDLKTGRGAPGQGNYIRIYPLEKRAEGWFIGLKENWRKIWKNW